MPKAINNNQETERHELKSLQGGFVVVRRLSYGEKLQRRQMVSGFKVSAGKRDDFAGEMNLVNEKATLFDFQRCIVDHNLEKDDMGTKLNFSSIEDIRMLDPRVGEEIDGILDDLNNFDATDEAKN